MNYEDIESEFRQWQEASLADVPAERRAELAQIAKQAFTFGLSIGLRESTKLLRLANDYTNDMLLRIASLGKPKMPLSDVDDSVTDKQLEEALITHCRTGKEQLDELKRQQGK